jgi:hypothetical protein
MLFHSVPLYYVILILILFCCVFMGGPLIRTSEDCSYPPAKVPGSVTSHRGAIRTLYKIGNDCRPWKQSDCKYAYSGLFVCGSINTKLMGLKLRPRTCGLHVILSPCVKSETFPCKGVIRKKRRMQIFFLALVQDRDIESSVACRCQPLKFVRASTGWRKTSMSCGCD